MWDLVCRHGSLCAGDSRSVVGWRRGIVKVGSKGVLRDGDREGGVVACGRSSTQERSMMRVTAGREGSGKGDGTEGRQRSSAPQRGTKLLKRSADRGWGTTVKWLSGLSVCVCVRTCFVGCPQVRPPLPTDSTSQIVPTGPSAPPSRARTDAHALAPNRITHQIKSH